MSDATNESQASWQVLLSVLKTAERLVRKWEHDGLLTHQDSEKILADFPRLAKAYSLNAQNALPFPNPCFSQQMPC